LKLSSKDLWCRAGAVMWAVVNELLIQPREYTAFNLTLDRLREDPRIMVTLGTPVSGYGQESHNRAARQRIPNRVYNDDKGREHVQARPLPHPRPPPMCRFGQEAAGFLLWSWHCQYSCTVCLAVLSGAASGCSCGCWECFKTRPEGSVIACFSAASSASFQDSPIKPVRLFWIFSRALGFPHQASAPLLDVFPGAGNKY
jgi:hypothetical protein